MGKTKRVKSTKLMTVADGNGLILAGHMVAAIPHEVTLIQTTLAEVFLPLRHLSD